MRSRTLWACVALVMLGCSSNDLRAEIAAAGVFSPRHVAIGESDLVGLGQLLFFDRELSGNRNIACSTCHLPLMHAADLRSIAVGQDRARISRRVPDLFNRGSMDALFWDGRLRMEGGTIVGPAPVPADVGSLLAAQALFPLLDRHEMRGHAGDVAVDGRPNELAMLDDDASDAIWSAVLARVLAIEEYRTLFSRAYPGVPTESLTIAHLARAIAAFEERLWDLTDTPFDDFLGNVTTPGNDGALDDAQRRGAELFFGDAGCARCHDGPLLSDGAYHAIGVPQIGAGRDAAATDQGRYLVTGREEDRYAFRTPPLRNVALSMPYMHDGAYLTLEDAVRHHLDPVAHLTAYDGAGLPADLAGTLHHEQDAAIAAHVDPDVAPLRPLDDGEVQELVAFLVALDSRAETNVASVPMAGEPISVPSGLPVDTLPSDPRDTLDR